MSSRSSTTTEAPAAPLVCRVAASADELSLHHRLRRRVFVEEQRLFEADDRDERDEEPRTLHVVGLVDGEVCGAVRLYPLDDATGLWKGDRLAVLRERRARHLGARLVAFAVETAGALGGARMIARVQVTNVGFFEQLGWRPTGEPEPFHGAPHQLMWIALGPRRGR